MKRIISLVGIWSLLAFSPGIGQAAPVGKVTRLDGRVDITSPGQVARPAEVGDEINVGDILRAKSGSKAEVSFVDGNILRLSQNTRVQITQYMVETDRRRGLFNLFRGRIQSVVKSALSRAFGQEWRNRFEVHTPTAVVGVRGTNFLTYYEKGVSGAVFYEGTGYGFSKKREDAIKTIEAGQAMLVVSADQPPMIRPATDAEMRQQIMDDKPPSQTEEEDGEQTVQAPTEEEGEQTTQTTTDQTGTTDDTQETATTDGTGTTSDPTGASTTTSTAGTVDSDATNTTDQTFYGGEPLTDPNLFSESENTATTYPTVGSITDPLTGVVPDEQPDLLKPFLQLDVVVTGSANLSFLESATLTGSIDSATGEGTLALQGTVTQTPPATQSGTVSGKMDDGSAFTGYLGGATGSWNGLLSTIYVKEGQAGYLRGHLSADQVGETILAGGPIMLLESGGSTITPDQLETALISLNQPLPILSSVHVGGPTNLGTGTGDYFKGIKTTDGRILGAWGLTTEGGTYGNTGRLETWSGTIGTYQPDTSYLLGKVDGTDLNANQVLQTGELGHVDMTGFATYLDSQHLGSIDLRYHGCYDPSGKYHSVGAGTYTLDPLAYSGTWGSTGGALYSNNLGDLASAGSIGGLFGERWSPWNENAAELFAMGDFTDSAPGNPHLWVAPILAWDPNDPNSGFAGFAGGVWEIPAGSAYGQMGGGAAAIYMDSSGNTGWLTTGDLTSTGGSSAGGISGILYPDHFMWTAKGMWTPHVKTSVPNPSDFGMVEGTVQGFLSGDFAGIGSISGELYNGKTQFFSSSSGSLPFGTYHLTLGVSNTYEAKPADSDLPSWSAKAGGSGGFGYGTEGNGYWLADLQGNWANTGEISAGITGTYLTKSHMGTLQGWFDGLSDEGGTPGEGSWIGQSLGVFEGESLKFSSEFSGDSFQLVKGTSHESEFERRIATGPPEEFDAHYSYDYFVADDGRILFGEKQFHRFDQPGEQEDIYLPDGTHLIISEGPLPVISTQAWTVGSLSETDFTTFPEAGDWKRRWYEEWEAYCLAKSGLVSGIMGGTADLWSSSRSAPAAIALMGEHEVTEGIAGKPSLFGVEIASWEIITGSYRGYLGGVMEEGIAGGIHALYVDPSQNAGILRGNFTGSNFPETGIWEASGFLYPLEMETGTGIAPDALLFEENVDRGIVGAWLGGDFGSQGTEIQMDMGWGTTLSLKNHSDWGVYRVHSGFDGFYSNPTGASSWTAAMGGWAEFGAYEDQAAGSVPDMGIWLTAPMNGTLQDGLLSASYAGKFLSSTKYGELFGDLIGRQDESLYGWQAVASGYWKKIQDLKFNGSLGGEGFTMLEENHGHWDNGTGSYYDYGYQTGINAGWSFEYNAATPTTTHVAYHPDGTTSTWIEESGAVSFIEGTYSGSIYDNVRVGPGGVIVEPDPDPSYHLGYNGHVGGLLGGLEDLWNPAAWADPHKGASILLIGEFDEGPYFGHIPTSVFSQVIKTHNPYDQTPTIWDQGTNSRNGGYFAYAAGRSLPDQTLEASILGIYVDAAGNGGFVKGFLNGVFYPKPEMWDGEGGLFPVALPGVTGYDAALLHSSGILTETFMDSWVTPVLTDDIHLRYVRSQSVRLSDQHWGARSSVYGGTYNAFSGDNWGLGFSADEMDLTRRGYLFSSTEIPETAGSWSDGLISGKGVASWVNWNDAVTGVSAGELKGTFNPTNFTWQAAALWASLDTAKFMNMVRSGQTDVLKKLNIPCVEIGRADLGGSQSFMGGNMDVNMQNVTFFSYSTGARPRIWATDQVTGSYSGGPIPGLAIPLSGANYSNAANLNASFLLERWDLTNGKWGAKIENGTGQVGSHTVQFGGGAAGTIDSGTSFSGTGSGTTR